MRKAAAVIFSAVMLLSGCSVTPESLKNSGKPEVREYKDDPEPEAVIEPAYVGYDDTAPEYGQPLVYRDFCFNDFDFLNNMVNEEEWLYCYTYWAGYDEDGDWHGSRDFFARMSGGETKEDVLAEYGGTALPYDPDKDYVLMWSRVYDDHTFEENTRHAVSYCDLTYPFPDRSLPFSQYAGLRFYFDADDDVILAAMYLNHDIMPLYQIDWSAYKTVGEGFELPEVEGETLIPRVMLKGMMGYEQLHTDMAYPCLTFEDGMVTVNWYDYEGNPAEGEGTLKDGLQLPYIMGENGIDFELPEGGDNMATYISYNSYLDAYELHDPYWRENYGCTLLLGRSVQQEVGER